MKKESNSKVKSEAELFLESAEKEVKEFITGQPAKTAASEIPNKVAQEQNELASIRAIRGRNKMPSKELTILKPEPFDPEKEYKGFRGFMNALERPAREAQAMQEQGEGDKNETERDYE